MTADYEVTAVINPDQYINVASDRNKLYESEVNATSVRVTGYSRTMDNVSNL